MSKQVILRPVFNRPEMLQLSLEYEIAARNYYDFPHNLTTIFLIEYGSPKKTIDLVKDYPFEKRIITRTEKFATSKHIALTKNVLEGMKAAFDIVDEHIIYLEDDILIHKTYFKFMETFLNLIKTEVGKFSYLSPGCNPSPDTCKVSRCKGYSSLAPIISKEFFVKYIKPCAIPAYYDDRWKFVLNLSKKYQYNKAWQHGVTHKWSEQAGLIARLVNIAEFEENMYAFGNSAARQRHIGFYGKNRKGKLIGENFEDRLKKLRDLIKSSKKLYEASGSKGYNDYYMFASSRLDSWDGTLVLV